MKKTFGQLANRLCLIIVLVVMSFHARADIRVSNFKLDRQGSEARLHPVLDRDGCPCALIKVRFKGTGLNADALQLRKENKEEPKQNLVYVEQPCKEHSDEVWFYVSEGTKRFRLLHHEYGNMPDDVRVKNGYYFPDINIDGELDYIMEISCSESGIKGTVAPAPVLTGLCEISVCKQPFATTVSWDQGNIKQERVYRVPVGEHKLRLTRPFSHIYQEQYNMSAGEELHILASPEPMPLYLFGGVEVGKPSSYSDLAYGVRVGGVLEHWGLYASMMTTLGTDANGGEVSRSQFPLMYSNPYTNPHYNLFSWHAGVVYRVFSPLHLYGGIGAARRDVTWEGKDGKRHAYQADHAEGFSWEAGLLCSIRKIYLSAGAEHLDGSYCGKVGLGIYLNVQK